MIEDRKTLLILNPVAGKGGGKTPLKLRVLPQKLKILI